MASTLLGWVLGSATPSPVDREQDVVPTPTDNLVSKPAEEPKTNGTARCINGRSAADSEDSLNRYEAFAADAPAFVVRNTFIDLKTNSNDVDGESDLEADNARYPVTCMASLSYETFPFPAQSPVRSSDIGEDTPKTFPYADASPEAMNDLNINPWLASPSEPLNAAGFDIPPFGYNHYFHAESFKTGLCFPDTYKPEAGRIRTIQKGHDYHGRLSLVTEEKTSAERRQNGDQTSPPGVTKYLVSFNGDLSKADGVGFLFAPKLPCAKDIKKICSLFLNKQGRVKVRILEQMFDTETPLPEIQQGEWVEMSIDLPRREATFTIWPWEASYWHPLWGQYRARTPPIPYGRWFENHPDVDLDVGHLACVLKHEDAMVTLAS